MTVCLSYIINLTGIIYYIKSSFEISFTYHKRSDLSLLLSYPLGKQYPLKKYSPAWQTKQVSEVQLHLPRSQAEREIQTGTEDAEHLKTWINRNYFLNNLVCTLRLCSECYC